MILASLIDYYDRLAADPENPVPDFGFSVQQISFCVVLNADGTLNNIDDMRRTVTGGNGKERVVSAKKIVPGQSKPPGAGLNPCFLWDNAAYMLGYKPDDPKPERTRESFEEFRKQHLARQAAIDDPAFDAVCTFLKNWDPSAFDPDDATKEALSSFGVFRVYPAQEFVHQRPAIRRWYLENELGSIDTQEQANTSPSLLSGRIAPIARLHEPAIKGVFGAQSSGARLVSFNSDAFESYGKRQGQIAPVAEDEAFKYCTALNALLADGTRRTSIGDATVVWWADRPTEVGESLIAEFFGVPIEEAEDPSAEDKRSVDRVKNAVGRLRRGLMPEDFPDDQVGFHVLGLSPNAARLSVRFWWSGSLGEMVRNISRHHADLTIGEWMHPRALSIRDLLRETARMDKEKGHRASDETIARRLSGEVTRAVMLDLPYPKALHDETLRRIRQDGEITSIQASTLKAILIRKGIPMTPHLDPNNSSQPYQCGRLFATLDYAQRVANPTVKSTLSARYLRGVMSTPGVLLGRLEGLSEIHIGKIDSKDAQQFFRDEIGAINSRLDLPLPNHLLGAEQSAFMLGYYKQIEWLKREVHATKGRVRVHRHRTTRGEWVRSALERRVLNALHKFNINYVYEVQRLLGDGIPRYPDILVNGATEDRSVYIEVAGGWKDEDAYNIRHEKKLREYEQSGISRIGGPKGYLRVLDFRGVDWKSKDWYDEKSMVIDALSDVIPSLTNQTKSEEN